MAEKKHKLFFVEDDMSFGSVMKSYLEINNFEVSWINDGNLALNKYKPEIYDMAILDVMLPHVDGFTIGKHIRKLSPGLPMIYLTAKNLKEDILEGYGIGADDYVTKPFDTDVLLCKIQAIINRKSDKQQEEKTEFYIGQYLFNYSHRSISINNESQHLSPKEANLLKMLCERKNELLSREIALQTIWGDDDYFNARSMDVYVTKLRKYLKEDKSIEIKNIHGSGFILSVE